MNRIRQLLALGSTFMILLVTLFLLVVLVVAGNFYPSILNYLSSLYIFEITIIGCLIELLYLQSTRFSEDQRFTVSIKERDYYSDILEEISQNRPQSVDILSAGLASRYEFIVDLIELAIPVRVLIQGSNSNYTPTHFKLP